MRADFQRFYDVDLEEALSSWSIRKLYDLIIYLPADAALWRALEKAEPDATRAETAAEVRDALKGTGVLFG